MRVRASGGLTALNIEATGFWNVAPLSLVDRYQGFGGIFCLHFQGPTITTSYDEIPEDRYRNGWRTCDSRVLGRAFAPKRADIIKGFIKLHDPCIWHLHFSPSALWKFRINV